MGLHRPPPTRPRSWWSWLRPNRSAFSIIMITAFGIHPTSTTVVDTGAGSPQIGRPAWSFLCQRPSSSRGEALPGIRKRARQPVPLRIRQQASGPGPPPGLDEGADDIRLVSLVQMGADKAEGPLAFFTVDFIGLDGFAPCGQLVDDR